MTGPRIHTIPQIDQWTIDREVARQAFDWVEPAPLDGTTGQPWRERNTAETVVLVVMLEDRQWTCLSGGSNSGPQHPRSNLGESFDFLPEETPR